MDDFELRARLVALYAKQDAHDHDIVALAGRVALLERTCQNDPPGGQGGSTFDPPGPAEGPVPPSSTAPKFPRETPGVFDDQGVHLAAAVEWESRLVAAADDPQDDRVEWLSSAEISKNKLRESRLVDAVRVLVRLVRVEYGSELSLAEIAGTWGDASARELEALRHLAELSAEKIPKKISGEE